MEAVNHGKRGFRLVLRLAEQVLTVEVFFVALGAILPKNYLQIILLLPLSDPVQSLLLRIDTEGVPAGLCGQDTILNRQLIRGKPL